MTAKTTTTRTTTTMTIFCLRLCHPNFAVLLLQEMWLLGNCQVYFVGDLLLNKKGFDWPVGTTALAARKRLQFDDSWRLDDVIIFFSVKFWPLSISGHCPVCPSLCFCRSSGQGPMRVEWRWVWWVWSGKLPDTTDIPPVYLVSQMWQNCSKVWRLLGFCWANEFGRILKLALTQWRLGLACSCWITHDRPLLWQESTVSSSNLSWPLFAKLLLIYFEFSTQAPHKIYSAYSWDIFCSSLLTLRHKRSVKFSASCCA